MLLTNSHANRGLDPSPTAAANALTSEYYCLHVIANDDAIRARIRACAIQQKATNEIITDPAFYLRVVSQATVPTFASAWDSALGATPPNAFPGSDPGVITDAMILGAVQHALGIA